MYGTAGAQRVFSSGGGDEIDLTGIGFRSWTLYSPVPLFRERNYSYLQPLSLSLSSVKKKTLYKLLLKSFVDFITLQHKIFFLDMKVFINYSGFANLLKMHFIKNTFVNKCNKVKKNLKDLSV